MREFNHLMDYIIHFSNHLFCKQFFVQLTRNRMESVSTSSFLNYTLIINKNNTLKYQIHKRKLSYQLVITDSNYSNDNVLLAMLQSDRNQTENEWGK